MQRDFSIEKMNEVSFFERFYWAQRVDRLNKCCRIKNKNMDLVVTLNEHREIVWPVVTYQHRDIAMKSFSLCNISIQYCPQSIFTLSREDEVFLYVCASHEQETFDNTSKFKYLIYAYRVLTNSEVVKFQLVPVQEAFGISYFPIAISRVALDDKHFVLVSGMDNMLHAYEVDERGCWLRTAVKDDVKSHWDSRLQASSANSVGFCLVIEEWSGGSQGVIGHGNGLLFADAFPCPSPNIAAKPTKKIISGRQLLEIESMSSPGTKAPISPISRGGNNRGKLWGIGQSSVDPVPFSFGEDDVVICSHAGSSNDHSNHHLSSSINSTGSGGQVGHRVSISNTLVSLPPLGAPIALGTIIAQSPLNQPFSVASEGIASTTSSRSLAYPQSFHTIGSPSPRSNRESPALIPPPVPRSRQHAWLLEGAITCLSFYSTLHCPYVKSCVCEATISVVIDDNFSQTNACSHAIIVGTAKGACMLVLLESYTSTNDYAYTQAADRSQYPRNDASNFVLLPCSYTHGALQSLVVADVTCNGYDDIVSSYHCLKVYFLFLLFYLRFHCFCVIW